MPDNAEIAEMTPADAEARGLPLVVDLDGTLIRSDMLYETFWFALSQSWLNVVAVFRGLFAGRAALKRQLADLASVDPALLPYNETVLERIRAWRANGGRVALVSASGQGMLDGINGHLRLFDEVHGSDGTTNLKGPAKAAFLTEAFGEGQFVYMGDSEADLPVWAVAAKAITVDLAPGLRGRVRAAEVEHLDTGEGKAKPLLKALRSHQWLKNALVFLPMLAAHTFDSGTFLRSVLAFVAFSVIASSVYLMNDLLDLAADRAHPRKRTRPFAAGTLPLSVGTLLTPGLILVGLAISATLGLQFLLVIVAYYITTTAYSFSLKRRLVIDICTLAVLYTLRIVAGGAATGIELSVWLLAFSIFFFFALAAVKRQAELVSGAAAGEEKAHGRGYLVTDLPFVANMAVSSGYVSVLVLALYVNSGAVRQLYTFPAILWGICLILLYWISRIVMITHRGWMHDDPVVFAARDRISQIRVPSLVLVGELDLVNPPRVAAELAELLPDGQFMVMPGVGHMPHIEDKVRFRQELERFLKDVETF